MGLSAVFCLNLAQPAVLYLGQQSNYIIATPIPPQRKCQGASPNMACNLPKIADIVAFGCDDPYWSTPVQSSPVQSGFSEGPSYFDVCLASHWTGLLDRTRLLG